MPDVASTLVVHQYVDVDLIHELHTEFDEDVLPSRKRPCIATIKYVIMEVG